MADKTAAELLSEEDAINRLEDAERAAGGGSGGSGSDVPGESDAPEAAHGSRDSGGKKRTKAELERENAEALERLADAEKRLKDLEEELRERDLVGLAIKHEKMPFAGDNGGWLHEVGPAPEIREKYPHLKVKRKRAVDEGEAIRWYAACHEEKPGSGKMIDLIRVRILAKCIDPGRQKLINHKKRISHIRTKIDTGQALTDRDQEFLDANEHEILGYAIDEDQ